MNDLQVEYFLAVARNLSFTKTAEELYVTQPAVSKQISLLEKELELALFDRTSKAVRLSQAGELFLKFFETSIKEFDNTKRRAKELHQKSIGKIRLGCLQGWNISVFFPDILASFSENYPNIRIGLECYGVRALIQALKGDKENAILTLDDTLDNIEGVQTMELTKIPKIILYSSKHPLANKMDLKPEDFQNEAFYVMSNDEVSYAADMVKSCCEDYGFTPKIQYVRSIESMNACVQNGMGVAITDFWSSVKDNADFKYLKLDTNHTISLAWKKDTKNEKVFILANEMKILLDN